MNMNVQSIAKFYNKTKPIYNILLHLFFKKGRLNVAKRLNTQPCNVLEIGCNEGQLTKHINSGVTYLGIDVAEKCIQKAQKKSKARSNINFDVLDGENTKIADYSFDKIILLYVLSVSPDSVKLIEESNRLLKPGGTLLIVNHFSNSILFRKLDAFFNKFNFSGVKFYFPISSINQTKDFNIAKRKNINFFWTYVELEKI
jgi:phosphatidylethanolamine/phosphatidyl-N-methylethanolamine N-methyltransferase